MEPTKDSRHEGNIIKVSSKGKPKFVVQDSKKMFETYETVELHALGNAVQNSISAADSLVK